MKTLKQTKHLTLFIGLLLSCLSLSSCKLKPTQPGSSGPDISQNGDGKTDDPSETDIGDSGGTPGGENPGGTPGGGDTPGGDTPSGDTPGGDTPGGSTSGCTSHKYDNGNFVFNNENDASTNGTWTFKCQNSGCTHEKTESGTMFRKGNYHQGFDELGKETKYPALLQLAYKKLLIGSEKLLDDFSNNIPLSSGSYYMDTVTFDIPYSTFSSQQTELDDYFSKIGKVGVYFAADNPRYYFLSNGGAGFSYSGHYVGDIFNIEFSIKYKLNESSFDTKEERKHYENAIMSMTDEFVATIGSTDTQYTKAKKAHDFLINRFDYLNGSDGNPSEEGYAHTMAGAAAAPYGSTTIPIGGVCECYAKAFAYLCNYVGVDCMVVTGFGSTGGPGDGGGHAWNYVKINSKWYPVDCTWDDCGNYPISYDYFGKISQYSSNHFPDYNYNGPTGYTPSTSYPLPTLSTTDLSS